MSTPDLKFAPMERLSALRHPLAMPKTAKKQPKRRKTFIKEWRTFRKLSQETLGDAADMSGGNVSLIETGKQAYTQDKLEAFAKALKCSVADLLTRSPADSATLWGFWEAADAAGRKRLLDVAKALVEPEDKPGRPS